MRKGTFVAIPTRLISPKVCNKSAIAPYLSQLALSPRITLRHILPFPVVATAVGRCFIVGGMPYAVGSIPKTIIHVYLLLPLSEIRVGCYGSARSPQSCSCPSHGRGALDLART
eukprot:2178121-Rhodomonas_salina.2